jgi:hypothetical protein
MEPCVTFEDVNLILKLYELRRETKFRQARAWFVESFHAKTLPQFQEICPQGSDENASFRMVISYWEMVASFMTTGVLHKDLFFQSGRELLLVWERVRDLVPLLREQNKDPMAYENLEKAASEYIEWMNRRSPGAYDAFSARMRGVAPPSNT